MKDQYVGDISDFEKYALLRSLAAASGLPLAVCWMLTPPDGSQEGGRVQYLHEPRRYRHLDPHVFDCLKRIVEQGDRNIGAVEREGVLEPQAVFFARNLDDHLGSRATYFRGVWQTLRQSALVFFDPDIGLAPPTMTRGRRRSSMYVFEKDIADGYARGHSLVIFDHWKRVQRVPYLHSTFERVRASTGAGSAFAVWGRSRVAFIIVPQKAHAAKLRLAALRFARRWPTMEFTDEAAGS
jgi:hypothetical protein